MGGIYTSVIVPYLLLQSLFEYLTKPLANITQLIINIHNISVRPYIYALTQNIMNTITPPPPPTPTPALHPRSASIIYIEFKVIVNRVV